MLRLIGIAFLLVSHVAAFASPPELPPPRKNKPLEIETRAAGNLMMMNGSSLGSHRLKQVMKANAAALPLPHFCYIHFVWDGAHLQVHPGWKDKSNIPKEDLEKDGWYVTADYSVAPPRVILTKEPTKHSSWRFVAGSQKKHDYTYIQNVNDLGKDAWLDLKDAGKKFLRDAKVPVSPLGTPYFEGRVLYTVLSFEKRTAFDIIDMEDDDGK